MQGQDSMMMMGMGFLGLIVLLSLVAGGYYYYKSSEQTVDDMSQDVPADPAPAETVVAPPLGGGDMPTGDANPDDKGDHDRDTLSGRGTSNNNKSAKCSSNTFTLMQSRIVQGTNMTNRGGEVMAKRVSSDKDCCELCYDTPGCDAWTYDKGNKVCYPKTVKDITKVSTSRNTGYVSGVRKQPRTTGDNNNTNPSGGGRTCTGTPIELSWYAWQNNTPCNSNLTARGKRLTPFKHVAIPDRLATTYPIGTKLYIDSLRGKSTPRSTHTGWVEVADTCKDPGCYSGTRPIVRLYIGDFMSAQATCTGTGMIMINKNTSKQWSLPIRDATFAQCKTGLVPEFKNYGGASEGKDGSSVCGVCDLAKTQMGSCYSTNALGNTRRTCPGRRK